MSRRKVLCTIVMLLMVIPLSGESTSYISPNSPFGMTAVWFLAYPSQWNSDDTLAILRARYMPKLDSIQNCGIAWVKCQSVPFPVPSRRCHHFKFEAFDSLVVFLQEKDLQPLILLYPPPWPPWNTGYGLIHGYIPLYFRVIVERYDGDGEGYLILGDSFPMVSIETLYTYIDTVDTFIVDTTIDTVDTYIGEMDNLLKPLKYWEICNEPNLYGGTRYGYEWPLDSFRIYLKLVSEAVHEADPTAKVLAPAVTPAIDSTWNNTPNHPVNLGVDSVWAAILGVMWSSDTIWIIDSIVEGDTFAHREILPPVPNAIDIITVHQYGTGSYFGPAGKIKAIDSCKTVIENIFEAHNKLPKPIWCTETGWHTVSNDSIIWGTPVTYDTQAMFYVEFLDSMIKRLDWFERTTFFALTFLEPNDYAHPTKYHHWGILDTALVPKPAYYAYMDYIKGYYEPHLWARDSLATANVNGRKVVVLGDKIVLVYQSRGAIVSVMFPTRGGGEIECDTIAWEEGRHFKQPAIAVGRMEYIPGAVHVVFVDEDEGVYYSRWEPVSGWREPELIYECEGGERALYPSIDTDSRGNVHVVFLRERGGNASVMYTMFSCDRGSGSSVYWEEVSEITDLGENYPVVRVMRKHGYNPRDPLNTPYVVWRDGRSVYFTYKKGGWACPLEVVNDITDGPPSFEIDKAGGLNFVWQSGNALYFERLTDVGKVDIKRELVATVNGVADPYLFDLGGAICVIYSNADRVDSTENPYIHQVSEYVGNIYLAERIADESMWAVSRVEKSYLDSKYPQAVLMSYGKIFLVWTEGGYTLYRVAVDSTLDLTPGVSVLKPDAGYLVEPDETLRIEWEVQPGLIGVPVVRHMVYYSLDGGGSYRHLTTEVEEVDTSVILSCEVPIDTSWLTDSLKVKVVVEDMVGMKGVDYSRGLGGVWWMVSGYSGAMVPGGRSLVLTDDGKLHVVYLEDRVTLTECIGDGEKWEEVIDKEVLGQSAVHGDLPSLMPELEYVGGNVYTFYVHNYDAEEWPGRGRCLKKAKIGWIVNEVLPSQYMLVMPVDHYVYGFDMEVRGDSGYLACVIASDPEGGGKLGYWKGVIGDGDTISLAVVDSGVLISDCQSEVSLTVDARGVLHIFYEKPGCLCYAKLSDEGVDIDTVDIGEIEGVTSCIVGDTLCVAYVMRGSEVRYAEGVISDGEVDFEVSVVSRVSDNRSWYDDPVLIDGSVLLWVEAKEVLSIQENWKSKLLVSTYEEGRWSRPQELYRVLNMVTDPSGVIEETDSGYVLHAVWTEGRGPYRVSYGKYLLELEGLRGGVQSMEAGDVYPFVLRLPRPNPSGDRVVIDYSVPTDGDVELVVYDVAGRKVRKLVKGRVKAGYHRVEWDRKDDVGRLLPSGVYFVRLEASGKKAVRKLVLMR